MCIIVILLDFTKSTIFDLILIQKHVVQSCRISSYRTTFRWYVLLTSYSLHDIRNTIATIIFISGLWLLSTLDGSLLNILLQIRHRLILWSAYFSVLGILDLWQLFERWWWLIIKGIDIQGWGYWIVADQGSPLVKMWQFDLINHVWRKAVEILVRVMH